MTDDSRDGEFTSAARLDAAEQLRRLGHALVSHEIDDGQLAEIASLAEQMSSTIESGPARGHGFLQPGFDIFTSAQEDHSAATALQALPDCIVSGSANPMGMAAKFYRQDDEAICRVALGAAFEGAPERAHGGIVTALFDHTMGIATAPTPAFTGRISVSFRAPTPLHQPLEIRARVVERQGRKLTVTAELHCDGELLAEGDGLFITMDPTLLASIRSAPSP